MKTPYYNSNQRQYISSGYMKSDFMMQHLAWKKACRQFEREFKKTVVFKFAMQMANLFFRPKYPRCLAEELSIKSPFIVNDIQPMIDLLKLDAGFDKNSKEAEQTHIIKEKSYKCIVIAMENCITPIDAAIKMIKEQ